LAKPPSAPATTSSVVAGVGCAFAQFGSNAISIFVGFGGVPSNFTVPDKDAPLSASTVLTAVRVMRKNKTTNVMLMLMLMYLVFI
jgi:hypothetical protein